MGSEENAQLLRVRGSSDVTALAGAISHAVYAGKEVWLRAIGAAAVNQAIKGVAIANSYVASRAMTLAVRPGFTTVTMDDGDVSAIVLQVIVSKPV